MTRCHCCGAKSRVISRALGFCGPCIRTHFRSIWPQIRRVHEQSRLDCGLPERPPRASEGVRCGQCIHRCRIPEGGRGYCGIRRNRKGEISGGRPHEGNLLYYDDSLPTNCVAGFVCPGNTGAGYPGYTASEGPEYGHKNLAVFYQSCSFNCLYCQNHFFREHSSSALRISAAALSAAVDRKTRCICYFGGDPTPQILHALETSRLAVTATGGERFRVCWETNGAVEPDYLDPMIRLSMGSGGCIKFDLKAWSEEVHLALCGVTNQRTLRNFEKVAGRVMERREPPLLIASTLLVPGYVDEIEVARIATFIAGLDPQIPYALLGFHPHFYLKDLPRTSEAHALSCRDAARRAGLERVHLGNRHLLGGSY